MNRRQIAVTCRQRIVELTHPQGTPLDIVLSLGPGMSITESTVFRADLQTARFPASAPLARTADVTAAPGATGPWTLAINGAQLNQTVTGEASRFWLPVYAVVGGTRIEPLVGIILTLTANNISSLAPPPPVEPIYLTEASASELYAALADFDALADRVTSLESQETGGAQADWNATSGPSQILNKPSLGNSSSRNVGSGAGDVAAGNHTHSSTSQIAGLDTALSLKADLSGGKIPVSQIPAIAISEFLGPVASQAAMLALNGERGDWCARTDLGKAFIVTAEPSSLIANWFEWIYPVSPVISVAGKTGAVTLSAGDIGDSTAVGRAVLTALDVAAARSALGLGALSTLSTIGTSQIGDGVVTATKLANTTVSPGTYTLATLTIDAQGRITNAANGTPGGAPAGSGSELQFRNAGSFGAVPNTSVSGGAITMGGAENYGASPGALITLRNTTPATAGTQQVSPALTLVGQGWNSTAVASQSVEMQTLIRPSSAAGPPTSVWVLRSRANAGAWTDQAVIGNGLATLPWTTGTAFDVSGARLWASACRLNASGLVQWSDSASVDTTADVFLRRRASHNLHLGPSDAASPVAQTLSVQSATGENTSASGAVFTVDGARGTGTGAGGDVRVRVAPKGSAGLTQNALVEAVRWRATDLASVCAGPVVAGGPVVLATFTVATVPLSSLWTRGLIWVSDDTGGPTPAFSDGANWRRVADRAVVAIA